MRFMSVGGEVYECGVSEVYECGVKFMSVGE